MDCTSSMRGVGGALFAIPTLLALGGCPPIDETVLPPGESVPFEVVQYGNIVGFPTSYDPPPNLGLLVAGSASEAATIRDLLSAANQDASVVDGFDFENRLLVFLSRSVTAGYGQTVIDVRRDGSYVRIVVELTGPALGVGGLPAVMTRPYHLVAIDRTGLTVAAGTQWEVVTTDGETLATTTYPE